jgi:hypothetical protein
MRTLRRSAVARAVGKPLYRANARLRPGAPPRVLANSLPKSGTHLLTALLAALPDMRYSGVHLTAYDIADRGRLDRDRLQRGLAPVRTGQYVSAHLPADPAVVAAIGALDYRQVLIVRDPRDAAVSDMHYIKGFAQHPMHDALVALPDDASRLRAVIAGLPGERAGVPLLESMGERLDAYLGWLATPAVLVARFEDLVGAKGGGDEERQLELIRAIGAHVDRPMSADDARRVASVVWSPSSSTFRRGAIGDWRRHFTDDHTALVKRVAGRQLVAMGYERDLAW